jgi:hypothetical protein
MMKRVALLIALLCSGPLAMWCQESPDFITDPRETMRGLLGVSVVADHSGCGGFVDKELAKQDIEVKLLPSEH